MNKETIEIRRRKKIPKGYGEMFINSADFDNGIININGIPTESYILGKICEFTFDKDIKVYSHVLRSEFILKDEYELYTSKAFVGEIPQGDKVYYLDIYYQ